MIDTYELWADGQSGEVYAVRVEDNRITGYCGPLSLIDVSAVDLPTSPCTDSPESTLDPIREWCGEETVPRPQPGRRMMSRTLQQAAARRRQAR